MTTTAPWHPFVQARGVAVLDGGLATELEADGHDLAHPLWSARLLLEHEAAIRAVHRRYVQAGADIVIAATYQATIQGLEALGHSPAAAEHVIERAVALALQAVQAVESGGLVAASVGPYGAFTADGAEFRGNYGLSHQALRDFHRPRWEVLQRTGAHLVACETVPDALEVAVLAALFGEPGAKPGWISVSCRDGAHLNDGTPIAAIVPVIERAPKVLALGINCTAPEHVAPLLTHARAAGLQKPAVAYPNSGEVFDPATRGWTGHASPGDYVELARRWRALGAEVIGGCCRTTPAHVRALRAGLSKP